MSKISWAQTCISGRRVWHYVLRLLTASVLVDHQRLAQGAFTKHFPTSGEMVQMTGGREEWILQTREKRAMY